MRGWLSSTPLTLDSCIAIASILLDESTSALDNESEQIVQTAIDKLLTSRELTAIVVRCFWGLVGFVWASWLG
jgi:hypothetical protein